MKVLHVNNVANVPDGLVKGLHEIGVDATLYQPYTGINKRGGLLGKLGVLTNRTRDIRQLAAQVRSERYDIVHIHYAYFGMLGIIGRFPYWLHCHGTDIRRNQYHAAYKTVTRVSLKRAGRVLYSTPDLDKHAHLLRPDATFLPNPIQTGLFAAKPFDGTEGRILLISRIEQIKGVDVAFGALERLKDSHPEITIDAFLWGPELEAYRSKSFVDWIPTVTHKEIAELIPKYQIVIGQFELGILGMSEMEAMACARPVICDFSYRTAYEELPPIVQAKTEDEIFIACERLLGSVVECEKLGAAGRDWVIKYHDYVEVAKKLKGLYDEYLSGANRVQTDF